MDIYFAMSTKGMKSFAMQKIKSNSPSALADRRTRPTCQIEDLELVPGTLAFAAPCAARLHRLRFHIRGLIAFSDDIHEYFTHRQVDFIEKSSSEELLFSGGSVDNGFIFKKLTAARIFKMMFE